ncbi:TPA: phage terminase small subunit [Serratia marcescens]
MLTPAQRHFQETMAARRGEQNTFGDFTAYEQMLHRLRIDKVKLQNIQSDTAKGAVKRNLIAGYQGWVDGALNANTGQADDVLTTVMIWNIDAGNIEEALRIGEYVLRHGLSMPDQYKRTTATALVDEICDPILTAFSRDPRIAPVDQALLLRLDAMTTDEDMPDQVRAKLFKAIGYCQRLQPATSESALAYLQQAITLFNGIGVKRDIENLMRAIKKGAATDGQSDGGTGGDADSAGGAGSSDANAGPDGGTGNASQNSEPTKKPAAPKKPAAAKKPVASTRARAGNQNSRSVKTKQ